MDKKLEKRLLKKRAVRQKELIPQQITPEEAWRAQALIASHNLFAKMAIEITAPMKQASRVNILVLGAGAFPSYRAFLTKILQNLPQLSQIKFTLVDPSAIGLCQFKDNFCEQETAAVLAEFKSTSRPKVSVAYAQQTMGEFLKKPLEPANKFDIVYLEHAEVSVSVVLLVACGFAKNLGDWALELPRLSSVLQCGAIVVAAVKTFEEQMQMERLLRFSLECKPKSLLDSKQLVGAPHRLFMPKDFYSGVSCTVLKPVHDSKIENKLSALNISKYQLLLALGMSCIAYMDTHSSFRENNACFLLGIAQLFMHDPNKISIKVIIGVLQMALCYKVACDSQLETTYQP